jgi:hypothetical protein
MGAAPTAAEQPERYLAAHNDDGTTWEALRAGIAARAFPPPSAQSRSSSGDQETSSASWADGSELHQPTSGVQPGYVQK